MRLRGRNRERPVSGRAAAWFARTIVALRWWIIGFWAVATLASVTVLPSFDDSGGGGLKGILSSDTPAVRTEKRSVELFGFPLIGRTLVVQRDEAGLSPYTQARTVVRAVAVDRGKAGDVAPVLGALPVTNTAGLFPGAAESSTTALTFLLFKPGTSLGARTRAARSYADEFFTERDHVVGVTGTAPARAEQGGIISDALPKVEIATLLAVMLMVGLAFRSLVAPVITVVTSGLAYQATTHLSSASAQIFDLPSPDELKPVVVALLLGVVTDYVVFLCSALREVESRADSRAAAVVAITRSGPIVAVAGLAVAAGTATLLVADSPFFRALGPALAFTVLVGMLVSITLVPALIAVLGEAMFWPGRRLGSGASHVGAPLWPGVLVRRIVERRTVAFGVVAVCVGGMLLAASPALRLQLGVSFVNALPPQAPVREAAAAAQEGFAQGILSPTVVLVEGDDVGSQRAALARLGRMLSSQPDVAGVLGPGSQPLPVQTGLLVTRGGGAARYLVVLDQEPLGASAVSAVDRLQRRLPAMLEASGLDDATLALGGDTATASFIVHQTESDLLSIALAAMAANLLMLLVFLRALVASLVLLACSVLSLGATIGITTMVFEWWNPGQGLTFYVPFATAVLLLAFGSDYNIFTVGHVWEAARSVSLRKALTSGLPSIVRAVTSAGLALAASFGLLVLVPLLPFRQLAFAMTLGIVIDVFVIRHLLLPSLLTLLGPVSAWPSRTLRHEETGPGAAAVTPASRMADRLSRVRSARRPRQPPAP